MSIPKNLELIGKLAKENGLSTPYVVGGAVRDLHLPGPTDLADVDITTGDEDAFKLAKLFADAVGKPLQGKHKEHFFVHHNEIKYDFSKDFKYPNIDELLKKKGIDNPTELQRETFSRDFTINTLLRTMDFSQERDLTGRGISDINARILACPVDCNISFGHDPRRILRAYHFKAKFGFGFSEDVRTAIQKNLVNLETINDRYAAEMINKILREDPTIIDEIIEVGILRHLPLTKYVTDLLINKGRVLDAI